MFRFLVSQFRLILMLFFSLSLTSCLKSFKPVSDSTETPITLPDPDPNPTPDPSEKVLNFTIHENAIHNPERGFHRWIEWADGQSVYTNIRNNGSSLGILVVRLDAFRTSAISAEFLTGLTTRFGYARTAGLKLILKFSYNEGPYPNTEPDASESRILNHIAQLKPVLAANSEVIAFVQAGFIGAWGEWHTSTNQLLDFETNPHSARNILNAILDALPQGLFTQLRYPRHKTHFYDNIPITEQLAFTSTPKARVGHHNDCFLANATDHSTYTPMNYNENQIELWKDFIGNDGRYAPVGGETCAASSFNDCPAAIAELARQRYTYLNFSYHPQVISKWQTNGCFDEIARRLGYRLALNEVRYPESVDRGSSLSLKLKLTNTGFATPLNPRSLYVVLESTTDIRTDLHVSQVDVRRWLPGAIESNINVTVPENAPPGIYKVYLWFPDPSSALRNRSEYSLQLANNSVWDSTRGLNLIIQDLEVK